MKHAKLGLFVLALTLSIGISSGVYASERNKDSNCVKTMAVAQKLDFKNEKIQQGDVKSVKKHTYKGHKELKTGNKNKCNKIKPVISVEDKVALKAKMDKIETVKDANKVLKTTIVKNAEAVKVELKRIEDSKIGLDPLVKTEAGSVLLSVKDVTTKKVCVKPVITAVVPASAAVPVVPIVDPIVPVLPVEKTYLEKLNERLDSAFEQYTKKNTELTTLATRLLSLLNALTLIK
ncbi:hypothetical protein [Clostridium estertheticum]|uniref:hypothetical protein n=1 Tax=Clostridium estertheticum TaxID=238834 RepID=UPI001C7DD0DB|nr:hypothetical protein [Clostridium estertheticum]MBX4266332.1 hypothetical protein [Clostridium estertheticum]WLC86926.1 hypothetical protein KTC95_12090 [Clostridium estertheticum]